MGTYRLIAMDHPGRNLDVYMNYFGIDTDYYADIGFIPRMENYDAANDTIVHLGYEHYFGRVAYTFRPPAGKKVVAHGPSARLVVDWLPGWIFNERSSNLQYQVNFANTSELEAGVEENETRLIFATAFTDGEPLPPGIYKYQRGGFTYVSDSRRALALEAQAQVGSFYNGNLTRFGAGLTYRVQPWGNFSLRVEQNNLRLPEPYGNADLTLINQRTEVNFSNKLFWTTFLQYNTQENNFNVNSRLQWRFAPMSDLFLVYTDNYLSSPFLQVNRNRGVVLKLNYWLTL
jgi:hypothetical protein